MKNVGLCVATAAFAVVACFAETKTSAAVAVMAHDQAFAPIAADANGGAADRIVDCPDVFEAALTDDFKVDGDLTKPVWKVAKPITDFKTRGKQEPMSQRSEVRLLYSA